MLGIGGNDVLESGDHADVLLLSARVNAALDVRRALMDEQAVAIARRVAELFQGGDSE